MPSSYNPGVPTGNLDLDIDYQNIQNNFSQLNTTYSVDHIPLTDGSAKNGYHKAVHMVQQVAPAAVSNVGSLYCTTVNDGLSNDEILYYKTGSNKIIQMTRNFVPLAAINGYTFLAGGIMLQWGIANFVGQTSTDITFVDLGVKEFPNNCFNVQTTINVGSSSNANVLNITNLTSTGFKYYNTSGNTRAYFWMAIGN